MEGVGSVGEVEVVAGRDGVGSTVGGRTVTPGQRVVLEVVVPEADELTNQDLCLDNKNGDVAQNKVNENSG